MRHIIIGDLHGRSIWKRAPIHDENAKVIFLGDYVDSMWRSDDAILSNLREIIEFKEANQDRVVLLIGNHDACYMYYPDCRCAGFRPAAQFALTSLFDQYRHHFQIAYQVGDTIFTHAGITNVWYRRLIADRAYQRFKRHGNTLADTLNLIDRNTRGSILYSTCRYRTGENSDGGPVWADYFATAIDALEGYHQIVGHTPMDEMVVEEWEAKSVTYLDVLHKHIYFHEMDI